jgi:hypothetical protein
MTFLTSRALGRLCILLLWCVGSCAPADQGEPRGLAPRWELAEPEPLAPAAQVAPGKAFRPARDRQGQLRLAVAPLARGAACDGIGLFGGTRAVWLESPRVEEVSCGSGTTSGASIALLVGLDADGGTRWGRKLGFVSGGRILDERLIGASRDGLVLSTLAVLSPDDGKELVAPRLRAAGQEARSVPVESVEGPALYVPGSKAILHFAADASVLKAEGGLWLFEPSTGRRELVQPVRKVATGAFWRVEDLRLTDDGRHVLLAEKLGQRGAGGVALAVFALPTRRRVQEHVLGGDHFCSDPRLVGRVGGEVTLVYRDESAGTYVGADFRPAVR